MEIIGDYTIGNVAQDIHFISLQSREAFLQRVESISHRKAQDIVSTDSFLDPQKRDGVLCITGKEIHFSPNKFISFSDSVLEELERVKQARRVIHMFASDKGVIQSFPFSEQTPGSLVFGRDEFLHPEIGNMTQEGLERYIRIQGKIGDKLTKIFMDIMKNNGATFPDESSFNPQKFKEDISRVIMF